MIELQCEPEGCPESLEALLNRVADACMQAEGISGAGFTVRIVGDEGMRVLNLKMRNVDSTTDVLSFPTVRYPEGTTARDNAKRLRREYDPALGCINLGDCVINLSRARAQAVEYGHSLERELGYLAAHSAFHLMGYDHMSDADRERMRSMEKRAMRALQLFKNEEENRKMDYDMLFERACRAREHAYAPYSGFKVGACILCADGRSFEGCNFENASFGATICAERCAAGTAIAAGARSFAAIAVAGNTLAWPCGICRQVLLEFACDKDMPVIAGAAGGAYEIMTLEQLLPGAFGPDYLLERKR